MYHRITDQWEKPPPKDADQERSNKLGAAFGAWCMEMKHAMQEVLQRWARRFPPAAKPLKDSRDLMPLCAPAAFRTKKPMNGKSSLLSLTKECADKPGCGDEVAGERDCGSSCTEPAGHHQGAEYG